MVTPRTQATIDIDGLAVFYETEGDGDPIVLLHGGLGDNSTWAAQFSGLSLHRRVVAAERQAQGHTPDRPGPLTYQAMTEQTVSFLALSASVPSTCSGGATGAWWLPLTESIPIPRPDAHRHRVGILQRRYVPGAMEALVALTPDDEDMRPCRPLRPSLAGRARTLPRGMGEGSHHVGRAVRLDG